MNKSIKSGFTSRQFLSFFDLLTRNGDGVDVIMDRMYEEVVQHGLSRRAMCHFFGQIHVETGGLAHTEESFAYRDPDRLDALFSAVHGEEDATALIALGPKAIAGRIYANRLGNGDEESGDGWAFRGSGYIQLTGRLNYRMFGRKVGVNLEQHPERARSVESMAKIALAYFSVTGCVGMAEAGNLEGVTKAINGRAMVALSKRRAETHRAFDIFGG